MDFVLISLVALIIVAAFLLFLGVYFDFARRSGIVLKNGRDLLIQSVAYTVSVLAVLVPVLLFVLYPLVKAPTITHLNLVIPVCLGFFGVLVIVGSLPLWLIHKRTIGYEKCLLLSARLMMVPVIDTFWSSVTIFVAVTYVTVAAVLSSLTWLYILFNRSDWLFFIIASFLYPSFNIPFVMIFLVAGLVLAYYTYKLGPSDVLSKFYLIASYMGLVASLIAAALLYLTFGAVAFLFCFISLVFGLVICVVYQATSWLYRTFRVVGIFGLELTIFSIFLLLAARESSAVRGLPVAGEVIYSLVPSIIWTIAFQVGIFGIACGILIVVVARKQSEKGQIMSKAMAIAIGSSALLPLFSLASPVSIPSIVGLGSNVFLAFLIVGPVYFFSVNFLRTAEVIKLLLRTSGQMLPCPNCGYVNRAKAVFCGKCGNRL